jgi:acyl carrier protein
MNIKELQELIKKNIVKVVEQNGESAEGIELNEDTQLFGEDSIIDSLDLVGIIAAIEERVEEEMGKDITIINEESIVSGETPFESIGSLSKLVFSRINEKE